MNSLSTKLDSVLQKLESAGAATQRSTSLGLLSTDAASVISSTPSSYQGGAFPSDEDLSSLLSWDEDLSNISLSFPPPSGNVPLLPSAGYVDSYALASQSSTSHFPPPRPRCVFSPPPVFRPPPPPIPFMRHISPPPAVECSRQRQLITAGPTAGISAAPELSQSATCQLNPAGPTASAFAAQELSLNFIIICARGWAWHRKSCDHNWAVAPEQ